MANELMNLLDEMDTSIVTETLNKVTSMQAAIKGALKGGHDFDTIPGTGKPTLLKPGAEKILMMFGLTSEYEIVDSNVNYEKGIFAYTIRCTLSKNGIKITEGLGSCSSYEKKYRYRWVTANEVPNGVDINTLKQNKYGKYHIENDEIQDLANTILKMAKKRAQVDAVLTVASLSEVFTQDVEDMAQFKNAENLDTMNTEDALGLKITFGKHSGKSLGEIASVDMSYIDWLSKNAQKADIKKAADMIIQDSLDKAQKNNERRAQAHTDQQSQDDFFGEEFEPVTDER